ncbi:MAG: signal peptidase I [Clostridiales bacterium]|nr:signal peptidase I [Clostridiales bacterium]
MEMENKPEVAVETTTEAEAPENKKKGEKKTVLQEILSWIFTLGAAVLIALFIRTCLFEPVRVDGQSMLDTLKDGEVMLVTKPEYIFGQPKNGDVVVCRFPGTKNEGKNFVKRIVGTPGDVIEFRSGVLYRNGEAVEEGYITERRRDPYNMEPITLGEDEYFVCGDNRINSHDCRTLIVGPEPITRKMIRGHVQMVVFPFSQWRTID